MTLTTLTVNAFTKWLTAAPKVGRGGSALNATSLRHVALRGVLEMYEVKKLMDLPQSVAYDVAAALGVRIPASNLEAMTIAIHGDPLSSEDAYPTPEPRGISVPRAMTAEYKGGVREAKAERPKTVSVKPIHPATPGQVDANIRMVLKSKDATVAALLETRQKVASMNGTLWTVQGAFNPDKVFFMMRLGGIKGDFVEGMFRRLQEPGAILMEPQLFIGTEREVKMKLAGLTKDESLHINISRD